MIIDAVNYTYDSNNQPSDEIWAHRVTGVFTGQGAVCEGYAKTLQLLLNVSNVENIYVVGDAYSGSSWGGHAWSLIRLDDGEWYWFDVTWNDAGAYFSNWLPGREYFAILDSTVVDEDTTFSGNHVSDTEGSWGCPNLPERAEDPFESEDVLEVMDTFTVGENTYKVVGYLEVHLVASSAVSGEFIIPETVMYGGDIYDVVGTGDWYISGQPRTTPVFSSSSITSIKFSDNILIVNGFSNCHYITEVSISKSTKTIAAYAFAYCSRLKTIRFDGTVDEWNAIQKDTNWNTGCGTITVYCTNGTVMA